jgi:hypothetical protein
MCGEVAALRPCSTATTPEKTYCGVAPSARVTRRLAGVVTGTVAGTNPVRGRGNKIIEPRSGNRVHRPRASTKNETARVLGTRTASITVDHTGPTGPLGACRIAPQVRFGS